jgi:hypothetical protein
VVVLGVPLLMAVVGLLIRPLHQPPAGLPRAAGQLTGRAATW